MPVTITHSTPADGTFSATGAAAWDATHTVSGLGTMAEQNSNNVSITGGSITGVTGVLSNLTVGTTATSGGAAGQIMFDTGSVLQESSNLTWDNTNNVLKLVGATKTGVTLTGVAITGTAGQFSCSAASVPLVVGQLITISGTFGGTGSITGYTNPTNYYISATNGSTTFTLVAYGSYAALATTAGTPTGLTYTYDPYPILNATQTWNNSNLAFQGLKLSVTNTASQILSNLFDFQINGISRTYLRSNGVQIWNIYATDNSTIIGEIGFAGGTGVGPYLIFGTDLSLANRFNFGYRNSSMSIWGFQAVYNGFGTLGVNSSGNALLSSAAAFGWNSSTLDGGSQDLFLTRRGAANLRFGAADAAAPVAQTLSVQSVVAGTSNTAGANLTITGSQGTGTGAGGSIIFQVAPAGSSGTAQNALSTALTIAPLGVGATYTFNGGTNGGGPPDVTQVIFNNNGSASFKNQISLRGGGVEQWAIGNDTRGNKGNNFYIYNGAGIAKIVFYADGGNSVVGPGLDYAFGFATTNTSASNPAWDTYITRRGAANLRFGAADAAAPVAQTLSVQSVVAGTSNTAGANLTITGSQGTGTGAGGDIIFQTALAGSSGTAQNSLTTALRIYSNQTVAVGKAYTVATLPAAGTQGRRAWVTDATAPTFLGTLAGGGAVVCPVFDDGTNWVAG